jgi:uncharacterized membrane protein
MIHLLIDPRIIITFTIGGVAILYAVLLWFMPRLTRHDLYFAVTVTPWFRDEPEGKSILRRYRFELIIFSGIAFIAFAIGVGLFGVGFVSAGLFIELVASFIAFYLARQRVLSYAAPPTMVREAELHSQNRVIPGGWIAASGPFILLAACAGYLWVHGDQIDPGATGHPNDLAIHGLTVYLLFMTAKLAALTLVLYGLSHWVRPVYAGGPEHARELKFRRTVSAIVLGGEYYVTLQASWIMLVPRRGDLMTVALVPLALVFLLLAIVMLARLGQGGSRMPAKEQGSSTISRLPVGDRTADRYWKLGTFYFNRDDSAVFVEKRFGLGYSLNFARPTAWIILLLTLIAPLILVLAHLSQSLPKLGV